MYATPTEQDARRVVDLLVQTFQPLRVILFGSLARGESDPNDIDLLVVMPEGTNRLHTAQAIRRLVRERAEFNVAFDVVVTTPTRLEISRHSVVSMIPEILHEGRELYVA